MRALTVLLLFSALFAQEVRAEQRVALVLGNSDYKNVASRPDAVGDADTIATLLALAAAGGRSNCFRGIA